MTTKDKDKRPARKMDEAGDVPAGKDRPQLRKIVRFREIPSSWKVRPMGRPDELLTVTIVREGSVSTRPLTGYIGAGQGVFDSAAEVDAQVRRERDAWEG